MDRDTAIVMLDRLHAAQNTFYGGRNDHDLRGSSHISLTDVTGLAEPFECTVGMSWPRRIGACWLLPLDQAAFDAIWSI